jgi:putative ABC transport system ATP-binding protein
MSSISPEESIFATISLVARRLGIQAERSQFEIVETHEAETSAMSSRRLVEAAKPIGLTIIETDLDKANEIYQIVGEGFPIILVQADSTYVALLRTTSSRFEAATIGRDVRMAPMSRRQVQRAIDTKDTLVLIAHDELECDAISAIHLKAGGDTHHHAHSDHVHPTPWSRFLGLLWLDGRDISSIFLFALVEGTLALATPLAVESLVNVVSWGTYLQPLLILALMLLVCLGLAGILKLLQTFVVEIIQRRHMVRIIGDLAHRFPRADRQALSGEYPRELANRMFDIMSIQKATAILLLDGVSIILATLLGMILLAAYHPFLLSFNIVLLFTMVSLTWLLGRGGVKSAIDESISKYRVIHWLQDVLDYPSAFRTNGGEALAVDRANRMVADYLDARRSQFRVVIRQNAFAIGLQVIASTVLLGLGGWLVIQGQLTLGQLVASELVVTVVVGAFTKAGKSLEKFYDLMAAVEKVGHLLDIPVEPRQPKFLIENRPAEVKWEELTITYAHSTFKLPSDRISAGSKVAILDSGTAGKSLLASTMAGLSHATNGVLEVNGHAPARIDFASNDRLIGYASSIEIFGASVRENVDLGRITIGRARVREALQEVGLWDCIARLDHVLDSRLQTGGYPLNRIQAAQLMIARAIAAKPKLLVIDNLLDDLSPEQRTSIWNTLGSPNAPWTLVLTTNRHDVAALCDRYIQVEEVK